MNAGELVRVLRDANPAHRFAETKNGLAVGLWVESQSRFVPRWWECCGKWVDMGNRELLFDGKPHYKATDWVE